MNSSFGNFSSLDNSSVVVNTRCQSYFFNIVLQVYLLAILNVCGIVFNLICVIVFCQIIYYHKYSGHMHKYLLVKSIYDLMEFMSNIFQVMFYCASCGLTNTYFMTVWLV